MQRKMDTAEQVWLDRDPVAIFLYRLHNERVDGMLTNVKYLQYLRKNYDQFKIVQKRLGYIFEERNINFLDLVCAASIVPQPDQMDEEDEEKMSSYKAAPGYAAPIFFGTEKTEPFKFTPSIGGGLLLLLPTDLVAIVEKYVGELERPEPEIMEIVPEFDSAGNYGSLAVEASFPLFA